MIALTFTTKTAVINMSAVPNEWRNNIDVQPILSLQQPMRFRYIMQIQPDDSSYRYRALMQKPQLVLKFSLPFYVEFPVGTYMTWQNQRFTLMRAQDLKKQGTRKIEYTMTLGTNEDYFGMWKLRNVVDAVDEGEDAPKDNRLKFSLCAKPHEFIDLIVRNLNKKQTSVTWVRGECIEASEKTVEFNHSYIDAALSDIANAFNTEYEVVFIGTNRAEIRLRRVEYNNNMTDAARLAYGVGNGFIPGVGRTSEADGVPVKRMFTQGTDRNIDRSKYGSPELLMPRSQSIWFDGTNFYNDGDENIPATARKYTTDAAGESVERTAPTVSDATKEDSLDCSEIYPSRIGVVTGVRAVNPDKNFYDIVDSTIPDNLNFNDYQIAGETMTLIMQDGMLAGKEFDVKYIHKEVVNGVTVYAKRFEIVPQEIDGVMMPNATFRPVVASDPEKRQKYAVFGIQLPDEYICNNADKTGASWDMMRAAVRELYKAEDQRFTFTGSLQALYAKRKWEEIGGKLIVGGHVLFSDNQFAKDGVLIRIVGIKDYLTAPYSPTIELSNSVAANGASVSSQLRQIENTEVIIEEAKKTAIQYTKRRFRDALETLGMLEDAMLDNFSHSVSPVAVQTMAMLVGDESLQFRFVRKIVTVENGETIISYANAASPIGYDNDRKQLVTNMSSGGYDICLQHMTLGQHAIMTQARRDASGYLTWAMQSYTSPVLDTPEQSYYLYARVSSTDINAVGTFVLSPTARSIDHEAGYYHLLCGVLNSEMDGERSYVSLYGFTEILPGRITTDLIISNDGKTYFDLDKGEIGGALKFLSDTGYITIIEGGKIKTELIDASSIIAKSLEVGEDDTQRVIIKPDSNGNGSVKIYDESGNEVTVLEGKGYNSIGELYDGTTGADCEILSRTSTVFGYGNGMTRGRGQYTHNAGDASVENNPFPISKVWHTNTPTEVDIKHGHVSACAHAQGFTHSDNTLFELSNASASVSVIVETYANYDEDNDVLSNRVNSTTLGYAQAYATAEQENFYNGDILDDLGGGSDNNNNRPTIPTLGGGSTSSTWSTRTSSSGIINLTGKKVRVPAGYHRVVVQLYLSANHSGSYAQVKWGNVTGTLDDITAKWLCDFYVSRYFANGFCLGTRSDNYILAYKTNDGMRLLMENSNIGFDFSKDGIRTRARGTNWMPLPMLLYKASYYYSSEAYHINTAHGYKTFNGELLSATRDSKGRVTLTFPQSWITDLGSIGVQNLLVHVNAHHHVIDARVESITTSAIKVAMSDEASVNDGDFGIVIYYLAS